MRGLRHVRPRLRRRSHQHLEIRGRQRLEITVWRNSCCLCAQCRHYCPTKAITLTNDWHSAHRATEKYTQITRAKVKYDYCAVCGAKMRVLPQEVLNRIYAKHSEVDVDVISHLCPNCRSEERRAGQSRRV